ncbi:hypothetical protein GCM10027298_21460 [Epidermidibacterium keratini]
MLVVFVGGPAAVFAICWLLAVSETPRGNAPQRYKLGSEWTSEPLWFVGREREPVQAHRSTPALESGRAAITTGGATVVGGASGTW